MALSEEEQQEIAQQYQQQKMKEQRDDSDTKSAKPKTPSETPKEDTNFSGSTDSDTKRLLDKDKKNSRDKSKLNKAKQGISDLKSVIGESKKELGIFGTMLIMTVAVFAIFIDILPLVTGDLSSGIDWILDIMFFIALSFATVIITGDIIGSIIGKKGMINIIQTIVEFIPVIDIAPFHTLAVIIITLDIKYNILSFSKLQESIPGASKKK